MARQNGESKNGHNGEVKESLVFGETSHGVDLRATLLRVTRHQAVFEIYSPATVLQTSEVINNFKIVLRDHTIYSGRAVVRNLLNAGPTAVCEATLHDGSWTDLALTPTAMARDEISGEFQEFVQGWQKFYLVNNDYKVVIADLQTFLVDLRLWLEQVELKIQSAPAPDRPKLELEIAQNLRHRVSAALTSMFERFEVVSGKIDDDLQPAHRAFGQRQLHPHLLCAPFIHRTFTKPLGYAGDYEMMNMIVRNELEGNSLYAKLTNAYLLDQVGPDAVRNRVGFLFDRITEETSRVVRMNRVANIYSIACGPAREAENFIAGQPLADKARFHLLDFNEETLQYATKRLTETKRKHQRETQLTFVRNSVQNLLRSNGKPVADEGKYDLIYCSGLYDYLNDRVCKALNAYLYDRLAPGGLLVVGNFAPNTPVRNFIEHFLEWFLLYRDGNQLMALAPEQASPDDCRIVAEPTGTNIFLEVRKPR